MRMKDYFKNTYQNIPKLMLVVIVLSLSLKEFYPLSHFPMYSKFNPNTFYVYLTNENDQSLLVREHFNISVPELKKMFAKRRDMFLKNAGGLLSREEAEIKAGELVINDLLRENNIDEIKEVKKLKIYRVFLSIEDKKVIRDNKFLFEVSI